MAATLGGRTEAMKYGLLVQPFQVSPKEPRQRFTGHYRDSETGLNYFGARYYTAVGGRFVSPDAPFADQFARDPQSWNLYGYVRNNPLAYVDEDGNARAQAIQLANRLPGVQQLSKYLERAGVAIGVAAASGIAAIKTAAASGQLGMPDMHGGPAQQWAEPMQQSQTSSETRRSRLKKLRRIRGQLQVRPTSWLTTAAPLYRLAKGGSKRASMMLVCRIGPTHKRKKVGQFTR